MGVFDLPKDPVPPVRELDADAWALAERAEAVPAKVLSDARRIVASVRTGGDKALRELTRRLDGVDLPAPFLPLAEWEAGAAACPEDVRQALDANHRRIKAFHALQEGGEQRLEVEPGVVLGRRPVPHEAVACYVPGGRATYPSTALMTVTPAAIAGCRTIIVVTPPRPDGTVDPAVLYAARRAGATHVLRAGGAQAIAAVAYGTATVPAVQAIVGPGNAYVTAAKQVVAGRVGTDSPAGPSEVLVVVDGSADPAFAALDLLAQAEHDPDAQVVLVATERAAAEAVRAELVARLPAQARGDIVTASLRDRGHLLVARGLDEALRYADAYAPEHLTLLVADPRAALGRVRNAGSVFLGPHAAVPLGDYGSGTNHVLPTMGHARVRGGLGVDDFRKWVTWQDVTGPGLRAIGPAVAIVARAEGLVAHAEAVEERLRRLPAAAPKSAKRPQTAPPAGAPATDAGPRRRPKA